MTQQKSELLKGLLECLPKEEKLIPKEGEASIYSFDLKKAHNKWLSEVRTALEAWVKGLELDEGKVFDCIKDKVLYCLDNPTETEDIKLSRVLYIAKALASKGAELVRVKK